MASHVTHGDIFITFEECLVHGSCNVHRFFIFIFLDDHPTHLHVCVPVFVVRAHWARSVSIKWHSKPSCYEFLFYFLFSFKTNLRTHMNYVKFECQKWAHIFSKRTFFNIVYFSLHQSELISIVIDLFRLNFLFWVIIFSNVRRFCCYSCSFLITYTTAQYIKLRHSDGYFVHIDIEYTVIFMYIYSKHRHTHI